jgi:hypothetical protein
MHPEDCFAKLLADTGAATAKYIAEEACETTTCFAVCAIDSFVGRDPNSIMISASGWAAQWKICQIARAFYGKAAAQAVSRASGWPMNALAAGQTLHCSLKCE